MIISRMTQYDNFQDDAIWLFHGWRNMIISSMTQYDYMQDDTIWAGWRNMIICRMTQYPAAEWSLTTPPCSPQPTGSSHRKWFRNAALLPSSSLYFSRFIFIMYDIQHCFICCPSDSTCVGGCWDQTPGQLRLRHWLSDALTTSARSHPLDLWSY